MGLPTDSSQKSTSTNKRNEVPMNPSTDTIDEIITLAPTFTKETRKEVQSHRRNQPTLQIHSHKKTFTTKIPPHPPGGIDSRKRNQ